MRAPRWATIPTVNATDIVPTRFSAASAAVHLAWADHPGPRTSTCAPRTCAQVMATTTLVAPEYAYPVAGNSDAYTTCSSQSPLSLLF